jgi:hypothetical protein
MKKKAKRAGIDVPANVVEFLARKITSNVSELERVELPPRTCQTCRQAGDVENDRRSSVWHSECA